MGFTLKDVASRMGRKGGKARSESLTPERRKEIASMGGKKKAELRRAETAK